MNIREGEVTHDEAVEVLRKNTLCDLNPVVPAILGTHPQVSYDMAKRGDCRLSDSASG
jgi:hypothetical protein